MGFEGREGCDLIRVLRYLDVVRDPDDDRGLFMG